MTNPVLRPLTWLASVVLGPVVAGLLSAARGPLDGSHVTLLLVLVVAAVSATGRPPAGIVAAVSSGLAYDFFWTQPYGSLAVFGAADVWTVVLLVLVGAAVELLGWWGRRERQSALRREDYLTSLSRAVGSDPDGTVAQTEEAITTLLGADRARLVLDDRPSEVVLTAAGEVLRDGRPVRADLDGLPTDVVLTVPAHVDGHPRAHFAVVAAASVARPSREQRQVAALLARLAGSTIDPAVGSGGRAQGSNR